MTIKNMIGLEAEFLLRNKGNKELTFPGDHGFDTDEYIILGEFRGNPGGTVAEVISNFMLEYYKVMALAEKKDKVLDLTGFAEIDNEFNSKIMRKMGTKQVNDSANIYGTDILKLSDVLVKDGEVIGKKLSCGLHIHFSSQETITRNVPETVVEYYYTPVNIPVSIGEGANTVLKLFSREKNEIFKKDARVDVSATCSRITKPVIKYFVETFDKDILPKYVSEDKMPKLKFRNPGFYELKSWGFEYRSLPFSTEILNDLFDITNFAFKLLEEL
jgi:hypothetical protein